MRVWILILAVMVAFSHSLCAAGCVSKQPDRKVPPCHEQTPTVEACPYQADADRTIDKASLEPAWIVVAEATLLPAWRPVMRQEADEPELPPPPPRRHSPLRI